MAGRSGGVLVVGALAFEVAGLFPPRFEGIRLAVTGPGPTRARLGLQRALALQRPAHILGLGLCGGLAPGIPPGSLAVPREIVSPEGGALPCTPWPGLSACGRMVSVPRPVSTPAEKLRLGRETAARWVDMESYHWADVALEQGIPCTVVRAVLDPAGEYLPKWNETSSWMGAVRLPIRALVARAQIRAVGRRIVCGHS